MPNLVCTGSSCSGDHLIVESNSSHCSVENTCCEIVLPEIEKSILFLVKTSNDDNYWWNWWEGSYIPCEEIKISCYGPRFEMLGFLLCLEAYILIRMRDRM